MSFIRLFLVAVLILVGLGTSLAQPGGGGRPCPKPPCPPPVPISGIEVLIGLGGVYGIKKMLNRSKRNKNQ